MSKEGGGTLCSLDCDPLSRSLSLKVSAERTNEPLGQERSIPCGPGVKAVPGISPLLLCVMCHMSYVMCYKSWVMGPRKSKGTVEGKGAYLTAHLE